MLKLRALAQSGVDVRVGCFRGALRPAPEPPGVRVHPLPELIGGARSAAGAVRDTFSGGPRGTVGLLDGWRTGLSAPLSRLALHVHRVRPDIVHVEWLTIASRCLPLLSRWNGPVVVSCRGSELTTGEPLSNQASPAVLPEVFHRADAVHVVSRAKCEEAMQHGLDPAKAAVIRPAVDASLFRPAFAPPRRGRQFRIVCVSWLRWLKGYEYALLAIRELAGQGVPVRLEILGSDPPADMGEPGQLTRILHTVRELGLEERVRVHGHLPPQQVRSHLQSADALLHSSLTEGLPNVVIEAMACAVPVVATDVGGTREAVRDGVDGFLVPPRAPSAAAGALHRLWLDPELRCRIGRAARERVEAEFTIERQTGEWLELYERVAGRR